jgi:hypothetical protein
VPSVGTAVCQSAHVFVSAHQGYSRNVILDAFGTGNQWGRALPTAVTGRKFKNHLNLTSISEPKAVEAALSYTRSDGMSVNAVISAGGESFMVSRLDGNGKITPV